MLLDKTILFEFLESVDNELRKRITLVAAGGTAMTLLDLKPSTIDIDFTGPGKDIQEFEDTLRSIQHGYKIDCWKDGAVFSQILPSDYLRKSILIKTRTKKIELRALHQLDIVVTKIGRLDERDKQDIKACIRKFDLIRSQITRRANLVEYVGRERELSSKSSARCQESIRKQGRLI